MVEIDSSDNASLPAVQTGRPSLFVKGATVPLGGPTSNEGSIALCGKIVIKAGRSQLEPFGVFLLIQGILSFLTSYSMLYLYLLFCY
jgi:hypothetical protein